MMTTVDANPEHFKLRIELSYDGARWDAMVVFPELKYDFVVVNRITAKEAVQSLLADPKIAAEIEERSEIGKAKA